MLVFGRRSREKVLLGTFSCINNKDQTQSRTMETPTEYYYTYYSYEEWGRGYIGSRGCKCLPEEDIKYFGSFSDKKFKPTQKIILKSDYSTREEALADEIILQQYYKVVENPHFANRSYQTSTKFYYIVPFEEASERGKINGKNSQKNKTGLFSRSKEKMSEDGKKANERARELGVGLYGLTSEQKSEAGKKGAEKIKELGVGIYGLTTSERIENAKKAYESGKGIASLTREQRIELGRRNGNRNKETGHIQELGKEMGLRHKENKTGIFGRSEEKINEDNKKGGNRAYEMKVGVHARSKEQLSNQGKKGGKKTSSQKWMCLETGYVTTPGPLTIYQRNRGIDTTKRKRVS